MYAVQGFQCFLTYFFGVFLVLADGVGMLGNERRHVGAWMPAQGFQYHHLQLGVGGLLFHIVQEEGHVGVNQVVAL